MMTNDETKTAIKWNRLGNAYFVKGEWQQAIFAYQQALNHAAHLIDAYYNLGLAYNKLGSEANATSAFEALLEIAPEHIAGRFQLALLLMRADNFSSAIQHFLSILETGNRHFETYVNLAACYLRLGKIEEARAYYLEANRLVPTDTQVLFNLGVINAQQGNLKEAIEFYLAIVKQPIDHHSASEEVDTLFSAHNNLGTTYLALKNRRAALLHFRAAQQMRPDNIALMHTILALEGNKNRHFTPIAYVRSLFNAYADHYDAHLTQSLVYQVPRLMMALLQPYLNSRSHWHMADLGCGTGLMGALLAPYAASLVGIDAAEKMLRMAANKQIYHALFNDDIITFLEKTRTRFDLMIAADVLPYFGQLNDLLLAVKNTMNSNALFIFTVEKLNDHVESKNETQHYTMAASGRFMHTDCYIQTLLQKIDLFILHQSEVILRFHDSRPVYGYLYLVRCNQSPPQ